MRRLGAVANGLLALAMAIVPPVAFVAWSLPRCLERLEQQLAQSKPLLEQEASRALERPVHFGKLTPNLSVTTLLAALRKQTFPIAVEKLELGARPAEQRWIGQAWLVRVARATVQVSPSALREGKFAERGVAEVLLESPEVVAYRTPDGTLSFDSFLPKPKTPPDPLAAPFQTLLRVQQGHAVFHDFASLRNPGKRERNALERLDATVELRGTRTIQVALRASAQGETAQHLRGPLVASVRLRRGEPTQRPDSPSKDQPLLSGQVQFQEVDLGYWFPYALAPQKDVALQRGWVSGRVEFLLATHKSLPQVTGDVRFRALDVSIKAPIRVPLTALSGRALYDSQNLNVSVMGDALGERFSATGQLLSPLSARPQISATLIMPQVPLRRALALLPKGSLPPDLKLGPMARLEGATLRGTLKNPQATLRVSGLQATWPGLPKITAQASLAYQNDTVTATALSAQLEGGGKLTGEAAYSLTRRQGNLRAQLRDAHLASIPAFRTLRVPPSGRVSADFVGKLHQETLTGGGTVQAQNLQIAGLSFPTAHARFLLSEGRFQVEEGTLVGPTGALRVVGSGTLEGGLALEGHLVGADLGKLSEALGLPGVSGTISASAQLSGTQKAPVFLLRDVTILQPSYTFDKYRLLADSAFVERTSLRLLPTGQIRVELDPMQPLRLSLSPAKAELSGTITGTKDSAQLNLRASADNLELDAVLSQLSQEPGRFAPPWLKDTPHYPKLLKDLEWDGVPRPPVSGFLRHAQATLIGDAKNPEIAGDLTLGRFLVADFPLEGGRLSFILADGGLQLHDLSVNTPTGPIVGSAQVAADGTLAGTLQIAKLDMETLSSLGGLVEKQIGITGAIAATLQLKGTRTRPVVTAQLAQAQPLEVIGIPLTHLEIGVLQLSGEVDEDQVFRGSLALPSISFQLGDSGAELQVTELAYDLDSRQISGNLGVSKAQLQNVVSALRSAHLDDTPGGRDFLQSLYNLPTSLNATFEVTGSVAGKLTDSGLRERRASLRLTGTDLKVAATGSPQAILGQLSARATLTDERLTLDAGTLTLTEAGNEEPTILRLLPHPGRDPQTGEATTTKSWLRLPYSTKEPLEYHLTLDSNAIPLDLIRILSPGTLPVQVQGKAAVTIAADGTAETPRVTASFFADNLLVGESLASTESAAPAPLVIDQLRFQIELLGKDKKDWNLTLSDGRLTHAKETLTFEGLLPYDNENRRIAASRPINLHATIDPGAGLSVATLRQYFRAAGAQLTGTIRGDVTLKGSLNSPQLEGQISLTEASARFPIPLQRNNREPINPIQRLDIVADLVGNEVRFSRAELLLARPAPAVRVERGKLTPTTAALSQLPSAGSLRLAPGSVIRLENLEDFTRLFVGKDAQSPAPKLRGEFDLKAQFKNFSIDTDNASALLMSETLTRAVGGGLEEAIRGMVNGQLTIRGPLLTPLVATALGENLQLTDLSFRVPKRQLPQTTENKAPVFNPRFAIALETSNDARLTNPDRYTGFEFKGTGGVTITGDLAAPKIEGILAPTGGYYKYPLAPFTVQRGGEIRLTYAKRFEAGQDVLQLDIRMQDVVAEGKVLVSASAAKSAQGSPTAFDPNRLSNQIPEDLIGRRITITARFNGIVRMGDPTRDSEKTQSNPIKLSSDSNLSEFALLSLLVPYQMLSQVVGGGSQQALRDFSQMFVGGLTGAFITPVTGLVEKLFGLDSFSLDYSLSGLANFYLIRRLPEPFEKVTIEVRRSFQTRSGSGLLLPQLYSLSYEIGQLRRGSRLQLGLSTNEQRDSQLYLRGTLRY